MKPCPTTSSGSGNLPMIIGIACGAAVLLLIIVIGLYCYCKSNDESGDNTTKVTANKDLGTEDVEMQKPA